MKENFLLDFCDPITSSIKEELELNPRVLNYSGNQKINKEYINSCLALMAGESNLKFAEAMPVRFFSYFDLFLLPHQLIPSFTRMKLKQ